jgi:hypothetical protein
MAQLKAVTPIGNLRCEYLTNPISIDVATPRFTWESAMDQQSFQLHVATDKNLLKNEIADCWISEKTIGNGWIILTQKQPNLHYPASAAPTVVTGRRGFVFNPANLPLLFFATHRVGSAGRRI